MPNSWIWSQYCVSSFYTNPSIYWHNILCISIVSILHPLQWSSLLSKLPSSSTGSAPYCPPGKSQTRSLWNLWNKQTPYTGESKISDNWYWYYVRVLQVKESVPPFCTTSRHSAYSHDISESMRTFTCHTTVSILWPHQCTHQLFNTQALPLCDLARCTTMQCIRVKTSNSWQIICPTKLTRPSRCSAVLSPTQKTSMPVSWPDLWTQTPARYDIVEYKHLHGWHCCVLTREMTKSVQGDDKICAGIAH